MLWVYVVIKKYKYIAALIAYAVSDSLKHNCTLFDSVVFIIMTG